VSERSRRGISRFSWRFSQFKRKRELGSSMTYLFNMWILLCKFHRNTAFPRQTSNFLHGAKSTSISEDFKERQKYSFSGNRQQNS
jgi:hypothetical protein